MLTKISDKIGKLKILELTQEASDLSLNEIFNENEIIKKVPIIKEFSLIFSSIKQTKDIQFAANLKLFLLSYTTYSGKYKTDFLHSIKNKDSNYLSKMVASVLSRSNEEAKSSLISKLLFSYLRELITVDEFIYILNGITFLPMNLIIKIHPYQFATDHFQNHELSLLKSSGFLYTRFIQSSSRKSIIEEYCYTKIGYKLYNLIYIWE